MKHNMFAYKYISKGGYAICFVIVSMILLAGCKHSRKKAGMKPHVRAVEAAGSTTPGTATPHFAMKHRKRSESTAWGCGSHLPQNESVAYSRYLLSARWR